MPASVDADSLVRLASAHVGAPLSYLGVAAHGDTGGAVFVAWPDGRRSVLTPSDVPLEELRRTASVLEAGRARGLPVPRYEAVVGLAGGGGIVVQERLPGAVRPLTGEREMRGDDLVHADFHHENVLFDERGAVTGVVDWTIRHGWTAATELHLDVADERLG